MRPCSLGRAIRPSSVPRTARAMAPDRDRHLTPALLLRTSICRLSIGGAAGGVAGAGGGDGGGQGVVAAGGVPLGGGMDGIEDGDGGGGGHHHRPTLLAAQ